MRRRLLRRDRLADDDVYDRRRVTRPRFPFDPVVVLAIVAIVVLLLFLFFGLT